MTREEWDIEAEAASARLLARDARAMSILSSGLYLNQLAEQMTKCQEFPPIDSTSDDD